MEFYELGEKRKPISAAVSIPNGMEFYYDCEPLCPFWASFNSQRDGILPFWAVDFVYGLLVSIPNGMEFYSQPYEIYHLRRCFNSQRDGILPLQVQGFVTKFESFNSQRDGILL